MHRDLQSPRLPSIPPKGNPGTMAGFAPPSGKSYTMIHTTGVRDHVTVHRRPRGRCRRLIRVVRIHHRDHSTRGLAFILELDVARKRVESEWVFFILLVRGMERHT